MEGLCADIGLILDRFESSVLRSYLVLFFFGSKHMFKKKAVGPRSHPTFQHTYTPEYFVHIYEYIYAEI